MKEFLIKYNKPNLFRIGTKRFISGINKITQSEWDEIKNHPMIEDIFGDGLLEWIKGSPDNKESGNKSTVITDFKLSEAKNLVKNTVDIKLLQEFKKAESRNEILELIDSQISLVTPPPPKEKKESKE